MYYQPFRAIKERTYQVSSTYLSFQSPSRLHGRTDRQKWIQLVVLIIDIYTSFSFRCLQTTVIYFVQHVAREWKALQFIALKSCKYTNWKNICGSRSSEARAGIYILKKKRLPDKTVLEYMTSGRYKFGCH